MYIVLKLLGVYYEEISISIIDCYYNITTNL